MDVSISPVDREIKTNKLAQPDWKPLIKYLVTTTTIPIIDNNENEKPT